MTADQPAGDYRVKVRTTDSTFAPTSPPMTRDEAIAHRAAVRQLAAACGDGWEFFPFTRYDDLDVDIRGREVIAVEVTAGNHRSRPRRDVGTAVPFRDELPAPAQPAGQPAPTSPGTHFLQSLPRRPQVQPVIRLGGPR